MKTFWFFGWHGSGVNGDYSGIGKYFSRLSDVNKPRVFFSVDHAGTVYEALQSYVEGDVLGFRMTSKGDENLDRLPVDSETGFYMGHPFDMAEHRHDRIRYHWPPELPRSIVWSTYINEPNNKQEDADYLGKFALRSGELCIRDGYRYAAWGWSGGSPEPEFWETPSVLEYLRLCEQHPDLLGVNLHLYSLNNHNLLHDYEFQAGRYKQLYAACDKHNIARPFIFAAETGWGEDEMSATPEEAMDDLALMQLDLEKNHFVGGCALWTKGKWHGSIVADMMTIDEMNTNIAVEYEGVDMPEDKIVIAKKPQRADMTEAENEQVSKWAFANYGRTTTHAPSDMFSMLSAGNDESYAVVWWPDRQPGVVTALWDAGYSVIKMPDDIDLPPVHQPTMIYRPSDTQRITQKFGNNPDGYPMWNGCGHGGIDIGVAMGWPFYATQDGTVIHASDRRWSSNTASGYGYHVVVDHGDCRTVYAHARKDLPVKVGDVIAAGTIVGWSGNTGNSEGYHEHFSMLVNFQTGCHPQTVNGWFIDPEYVMALPKPPPAGRTYKTSDFMIADPRSWVVVDRGANGNEDIFTITRGSIEERIKNHQQKEVYAWRDGVPFRLLDNSMQSVNDPNNPEYGIERLYKQFTNGVQGGQIAPAVCDVGVTYTYQSLVKVYAKDDCRELSTNSGNAPSTFQLVARHEDYTFANDFHVDVFWETIQTNEWQFYCEKDGIKMGWSGGGAKQDNNEWSAMPIEFYIDRHIPTPPPPDYC